MFARLFNLQVRCSVLLLPEGVLSFPHACKGRVSERADRNDSEAPIFSEDKADFV